MVPKVARIQRLIEDGFVLETIDSDHGIVEARLRRGTTSTTVRLGAADAEELLYGRSLRRRPDLR